LKSGSEISEAVILVILFLVLTVIAFSIPAHGDAPRYQGARIDRHASLTLARMCAGETGPRDLTVCAAQVGVIARRAARRGISMSTMARLYSAALRRPSRAWVPLLTGGARPVGFPRTASWRRYRGAFRSLEQSTQDQLAGRVDDPCPAALHFGSLHLDGHRMRAWRRVCEGLHDRQGFWGHR